MGLSPQPAESDMTPDRHIRIDIQLIAISVSNSDTHFNIRIAGFAENYRWGKISAHLLSEELTV